MKVRFGIFTDLHTEYIHDSVARVREFLDTCKREKVDFCIELGDFCPPGELNKEHKKQIFKLIKESKIPFYHALGNHDMDKTCKADVLNTIDLKNSYYSFDCGNLHFVVLDGCYFEKEGKEYSYELGNQKESGVKSIALLPHCELEWLKNDLAKTKFPSVFFSHHSLIESRASIANCEDFRNVVKQSPCGAILAICGHEHIDRLEQTDGFYYYCLNSMSYYWAGSKYEHETYGSDIEKSYPLLRKVFPYSKPLYAIIDINDNEITISGRNGEFVGVAPDRLGFQRNGLVDKITPNITDRKIKRQG